MNVPKLRFPGFEGEWEEKRLDEVAFINRGKSKHRPRDAAHLYGGKYPFVQTGDIKSADLYLTEYTQTYSEDGLKQSKLWYENTLCVTIAANIAETAILKIKACFPDSIIGLIPKGDETIVLFLKYQFDKFKIEIQKLSQGLAQDNLNQEKLSNINFKFPSLTEQTKIASFLSAVDEKLQALKKKKELLQQYKQGVMQKIFAQEIRFKDDDGNAFEEWEEREIGDVFKERSESGFSNLELLSVSINYGVSKKSDSEKRDNSSEDKSNYKKVEPNDIVYNSMRMWQGASGLSEHEGIVSPAYTVIKPNDGANSLYFAYLFKTPDMIKIFERNSQGLTSDTWNLKYPQLSKIKVIVPAIKEQTKIANFLSSIDEKINHCQTQITATEQYKKALLQQMFV